LLLSANRFIYQVGDEVFEKWGLAESTAISVVKEQYMLLLLKVVWVLAASVSISHHVSDAPGDLHACRLPKARVILGI